MYMTNIVTYIKSGKVLLFLSALFIFTLTASSTTYAKNAKEIYSSYKGGVLQIRIVDISSGVKATIGSGFIVSTEGHVITNYHVVSKLVGYPERYRAEFLDNTETKGVLTLLDLDIVHDLALLRSDKLAGKPFQIEPMEPANGEGLFSLGNPYDLGLTIVEGTFNGYLKNSLYEKIHFTGSINPGMSGGPTLNKDGRVVGVNVATAGNQVSFLVPSRYVSDMVSGISAGTTREEDFFLTISKQITDNQSDYIGSLLATPFSSVQIGNYTLPGELAEFITCWGDTRKTDHTLFEQVYHNCSSNDVIFISDTQSSGTINFRHELFRTDKLSSIRFYNYLEKHFKRPHIIAGGEEESVGSYQCSSDFVEHNGLDYKVVFCMRGYKKLEGLYDSFMAATTLVSNRQSLHTTLVLSGVSYNNAIRFSRSYLEAIAWNK